MNQYEFNSLREIIQKFKDKPAFCLISKAETESCKLKFSEVEKNLADNKYASIFDFVLDIRFIIMSCKEFYDEQHENILILNTLSQWFEKKIQKVPHDEKEYIDTMLQKYLRDLMLIERSFAINSYIVEDPNIESEQIDKETIGDYENVSYFQNYISRLTEMHQYQTVLTILRNYGINVDPVKESVINFDEIPKACKIEIFNYIYRQYNGYAYKK